MSVLVKKWLVYGILFMLGLFAAMIAKKHKQKETTIEQRQVLPALNFKDLNGKPLSVEKNKSVVVIYFHPDCDYCSLEMDYIRDNIDALRASEIVLISSADRDATLPFVTKKGVDKFSNVKIGLDSNDEFFRSFASRMIPSIFIYDKKGHLQKFYKGETSIETILKYLQKDA